MSVTRADLERAIDLFFDSAYQAVEYVGTANYPERECEAKGWITKARMEARDAILPAAEAHPVAEAVDRLSAEITHLRGTLNRL